MSHHFYSQFTSFKEVERQYGTSYYWATKLFPRRIRHATYALYTWVRIPDEIVDNSPVDSMAETQTLLLDYVSKWKDAYNTRKSDIPVLQETAKVFHAYGVPFEHSTKFLEAMIQDLNTNRYETYGELEDYMAGSAAAVGLMMSHILGFKDGALFYAKKLGDAMQLTNFLRDVQEDIDERDRIYFPLDELRAMGISPEDFVAHHSDKLRPFIQQYVKKARTMYQESMPGIFMLKRGRLAVAYAAFMYRAILDKIEEQDFDVFTGRVYTTKRDKLVLLCKTILFLIRRK